MKTLTKKIVLSVLVMSLSACAYHPNHYNSYPGNGYYYPGHSGNGNYQQQYPHHHGWTSSGYWSQGWPYGVHNYNNYYQNNSYNRPQTRQYQASGYGHQGGWQGRINQPQPMIGHHDNRHSPPARPNSGGPAHQGGQHNRPSNGGGWQSQNNQPQPAQAHHDDRQIPLTRRENHPMHDPGHNGHNQNNGRHQQPFFGK